MYLAGHVVVGDADETPELREGRVSNGKQSGPRIGIEKGSLTGGGAGLSR